MIKYPKIKAPYKRDTNTNKLTREYVCKELEYLAEAGCEFIATEKIDGTNISIDWDGYTVSFHGRTERADIPKHLLQRLEELFGGSRGEHIFEEHFGDKHVVLFGEGYGAKIQKGGGLYSETPEFILFDVYFPESDLWAQSDLIYEIASYFGIEQVPVFPARTLEEWCDFIAQKPKSLLNHGKHDMEGVVIKPAIELKDRRGNRLMYKVKACDFKE